MDEEGKGRSREVVGDGESLITTGRRKWVDRS